MSRQELTMTERCDELTKDGKVLSITWNGGNDSGWFEMKLDDETIGEDTNEMDPIIEHVADHLEYGSFAGDFSTDGELVYNRETKCFEGTDTYSETDNADKQCTIKVPVTKEIWFDHLQIQIEAEDQENPAVSVAFIITNGPRIANHSDIGLKLEHLIKKQVKSVIATISNFSGLWENLRIPFRDFQDQNGKLVHVIKQLTYSLNKSHTKEIEIQIPEN